MTKSEFEKTVFRLEEALAQEKNDFIRDSVIQRFEFSIELAWKTMKKVSGISATAPKDVIREMAKASYIDSPEMWLEAIDMRNLSSHTYKEELAEKVYDFARNFLPELKAVLNKISKK